MSCSVKKAKIDGASNMAIESTLYEARTENIVANDPDLLQEVQDEYGIYMARPDNMFMEYTNTK